MNDKIHICLHDKLEYTIQQCGKIFVFVVVFLFGKVLQKKKFLIKLFPNGINH